MARVPGPGKRTIFTQIPSIVDTGEGAGAQALAEGLGSLAGVLSPLAAQESAAAGAAAVTRDADGNLVAKTRIPFTEVDRVYNQAAASIYTNEIEGEISAKIAEMTLQYDGDPEGFKAAVAEYRSGLMKTTPTAFKGDVGMILGRRANSSYTSLVTRKYQDTQARAINSNDARRQRILNRIVSLSEDPTPENLAEIGELRGELSGLQSERAQLPGSRYTEEDAKLESETAIGKATAAFDKSVGAKVDTAIDILKAGEKPADLEELAAQASGTSHAARLNAQVQAYELRPDFAALSPREQDALIREYREARPNGLTEDEAGIIDAFEKTRDASLDGLAKDAVGHYEALNKTFIINGSDDLLDPDVAANLLSITGDLADRGLNPTGRIFSDRVTKAINADLKSKDPARVAVAISGLANFGRRESARAMSQLDLTPEQRRAVTLVTQGGSPDTVSKIIAGSELPSTGDLDWAEKADVIAEIIGDAIGSRRFESPTQRDFYLSGVRAAADAIYRAEMNGLTDTSEEGAEERAKEVYGRALQQALGQNGSRGGVREINGQNTYLPPQVDANLVENAWRRAKVTLYDQYQSIDYAYTGESALNSTPEERSELWRLFWNGVSIKRGANGVAERGGFPVIFGKRPGMSRRGDEMRAHMLSENDLSRARIRSVNEEVYTIEMPYSGGLWVPVMDSSTGRPFMFDIRAFQKKGL